MLHTKRDSLNLAKLARFMSAVTIAMVLLPPAAHGQSLKDKCRNAVNRDSDMETQLKNGKMLIAGGFALLSAVGHVIGYKPEPVGKAEICDPATGKLRSTGSMIVSRCCASATLLQNGQVLIAGGTYSSAPLSKPFKSAELYDPTTGAFTAVGNMTIGRRFHTATLLPNGRVLVAGGAVNRMTVGTAELYNPDTRSFEPTGDMHSSRASHTATLTSEGRVLIAGGVSQSIPEATAAIVPRNDDLYDPQTGIFSLIGGSH